MTESPTNFRFLIFDSAQYRFWIFDCRKEQSEMQFERS